MKKRRQSGFTLIEALLLTLIIGIGTMAWLSTMTGYMKISKKGRASFQMVLEQKALSKLIDSMPSSAVSAASKGCLHPYKKFVSPNMCESNMAAGVDITAVELSAWKDLSVAVFKWVGASNSATMPSDQVMSQDFFNTSIRPKLTAAGCMECHGGGAGKSYVVNTSKWLPTMNPAGMRQRAPQIEQRDFANYDHMVKDFSYTVASQTMVSPALASKGIFNSVLGQTMLSEETTVEDYLGDSHGIVSKIKFTSRDVEFSMKTVIPNARSDVHDVEGFCASAASQCSSDEVYVMDSCSEHCSAHGPQPTCSCGKDCTEPCGDPPCIEWTADYQCLSDRGTEHNGISGISGHYQGAPDFVNQTWEARGDDQCTVIEGNTPCSKYLCDPDPNAPWHVFGKCVVAGSCKRHCEEVQYSAAYSCGKDCFVPSRPIDCNSQRWEFDCQVESAMSTKSGTVVSYSISTQYTDPETKDVKSLVTGGALK